MTMHECNKWHWRHQRVMPDTSMLGQTRDLMSSRLRTTLRFARGSQRQCIAQHSLPQVCNTRYIQAKRWHRRGKQLAPSNIAACHAVRSIRQDRAALQTCPKPQFTSNSSARPSSLSIAMLDAVWLAILLMLGSLGIGALVGALVARHRRHRRRRCEDQQRQQAASEEEQVPIVLGDWADRAHKRWESITCSSCSFAAGSGDYDSCNAMHNPVSHSPVLDARTPPASGQYNPQSYGYAVSPQAHLAPPHGAAKRLSECDLNGMLESLQRTPQRAAKAAYLVACSPAATTISAVGPAVVSPDASPSLRCSAAMALRSPARPISTFPSSPQCTPPRTIGHGAISLDIEAKSWRNRSDSDEEGQADLPPGVPRRSHLSATAEDPLQLSVLLQRMGSLDI